MGRVNRTVVMGQLLQRDAAEETRLKIRDLNRSIDDTGTEIRMRKLRIGAQLKLANGAPRDQKILIAQTIDGLEKEIKTLEGSLKSTRKAIATLSAAMTHSEASERSKDTMETLSRQLETLVDPKDLHKKQMELEKSADRAALSVEAAAETDGVFESIGEQLYAGDRNVETNERIEEIVQQMEEHDLLSMPSVPLGPRDDVEEEDPIPAKADEDDDVDDKKRNKGDQGGPGGERVLVSTQQRPA